MHLKIIFLIATFFILFINNVWACHKGGPMGFATNDPGGFSLDITLSPTYTGASTLGTLNCKNWDYTQHKKKQFIISQWSYINEEASQGKGNNLVALAQIIGCTENIQKSFSSIIQENYSLLFGNSQTPINFFEKLEIIISKNFSPHCSG